MIVSSLSVEEASGGFGVALEKLVLFHPAC